MVIYPIHSQRRKSCATGASQNQHDDQSFSSLPCRSPRSRFTTITLNEDIPISRIGKGRQLLIHKNTGANERKTILQPSPTLRQSSSKASNTLLTHLSIFPERTLPIPFSRPNALDSSYDVEFKRGQVVRVREFDAKRLSWSEWKRGIVVEIGKIKYPLGGHARGYQVKYASPNGSSIMRMYRGFLGEICRLEGPLPAFSPAECVERLASTRYVYARVKDSRIMSGLDVKLSDVWIKASVLRWDEGKPAQVIATGTSVKGHSFEALGMLPYTPDTALACQIWGSHVSEFTENEENILPPLDPQAQTFATHFLSSHNHVSRLALKLIVRDLRKGEITF